MRVLFVTLPAFGHAAPLIAIASEVAHRGHPVAWVADRSLHARLRPPQAVRFDAPSPLESAPVRSHGRMLDSVRDYFHDVLPGTTAAMLPAVRDGIDRFAPDVVVVEQNCLAGSIAARLAGIPWVCVHVTPILLLQPFRSLPQLDTWIEEQVARVQRTHGVEPLQWPLRSASGTLIASSAAFLGEAAALEPGDQLVGALLDPHAHDDPSPWLGPAPRVLVSLGTRTAAAGRGFLERAVAALPPTGSAIVAAPGDVAAPPGVRVAPWVPQVALMPHLSAVVGHGGQNTVTEALRFGVPLVLAPIQHDQPAVAARVEALGAGLRLSFEDATVDDLRAALQRVLREPSFAAAARRVGDTLGPGTPAAADAVLGVAS